MAPGLAFLAKLQLDRLSHKRKLQFARSDSRATRLTTGPVDLPPKFDQPGLSIAERPNTISGLIDKAPRAAGRIQHARREPRALVAGLDHVDARIDPDM